MNPRHILLDAGIDPDILNWVPEGESMMFGRAEHSIYLVRGLREQYQVTTAAS